LDGRPTRDIVIIVFAVAAAGAAFAAIVGLLAIELAHPSSDTTGGFKAFAEIIAVMFGAVMGYMLGRRNNTKSSS
jgi:membrane associated rhomboid family serine protease